MNRRAFLGQTVGGVLLGAAPNAQPDPQRALSSYLIRQLDALAAKWDANRGAIQTPRQMEARNQLVREQVRSMLNIAPEPATLDAKVTRTAERDGYRIENIMFQSRPGLWVTGNLYIPTSSSGPFPAIISPCGHYELARMYPDYQFAYIDLVKSGFVVFAYDPTGQGERRHYGGELRSVDEHSMEGQLLLLLGENLTGYLVRDGMRAIDYLLTRPEVDEKRIGCAGHSGGGTLTMFLACADERIRCVVINEGGTAHRWPVTLKKDGSPPISDAEQNLFPAAVHGIDTCDMHVAIAPRPLLVLIELYGTAFDASAAHIRARYELLGVGDRFATEEARARHAWTDKLRLATVNWFCRWFYGKSGPMSEPEMKPESPETLYCTPGGSLRDARIGETIYSVINRRASSLSADCRVPDAGQIRRLLRLPKTAPRVSSRRKAITERNGIRIEQVAITPEAGIVLAATVYTPSKRVQSAAPVILLSESEDGLALAAKGARVTAVRVRGAGHEAPAGKPFAHLFDTDTACAYMAWYLDRELMGMWVFDVLQTIEFADTRSVRLIGEGRGALCAMFAAALDPRVSSVTCRGGLLSYRCLAESDRYTHGAGIFVRGILREFDLPQLAAAIAPRALVVEGPVDAMGQPVPMEVIAKEYRFTRVTFDSAGAASRLRLSVEVRS